LVGSALAPFLNVAGHTVHKIARPTSKPAPSGGALMTWNTSTGELGGYTPIDTLVHLAGRNITTRWTKNALREIYDSRVSATEKPCRLLAYLPADQRPKPLISASAIGFYGERGDEELTEASPPPPESPAHMPRICKAWEAATRAAEDAGIQTIHL